MDFMDAMTGGEVLHWLKTHHEDRVPLRWIGKAAKVMGLTGEADLDTVYRVLCYGDCPNGSKLAIALGGTSERADGHTYREIPTVGYVVELRPHKSVTALLADPTKREAVLDAHRAAVEAAFLALEKEMGLMLVGVVATHTEYHETKHEDWDWSRVQPPMLLSEVVFAASGCYWVGGNWTPLGTVFSVLNTVLPAFFSAFSTYHGCLGDELSARLGDSVNLKYCPYSDPPIAIVE